MVLNAHRNHKAYQGRDEWGGGGGYGSGGRKRERAWPSGKALGW